MISTPKPKPPFRSALGREDPEDLAFVEFRAIRPRRWAAYLVRAPDSQQLTWEVSGPRHDIAASRVGRVADASLP